MKLTKEECYEALDYLEGRIVCITVKMKRRLEKLINEHFDNPPLKFEELEEGMWVWDKKSQNVSKNRRNLVYKNYSF